MPEPDTAFTQQLHLFVRKRRKEGERREKREKERKVDDVESMRSMIEGWVEMESSDFSKEALKEEVKESF